MHRKKLTNNIKFRFITIALSICQVWKIPVIGLKQSKWNLKQAIFYPQTFTAKVFIKNNNKKQVLYICYF